jgi:hypothetical protein
MSKSQSIKSSPKSATPKSKATTVKATPKKSAKQLAKEQREIDDARWLVSENEQWDDLVKLIVREAKRHVEESHVRGVAARTALRTAAGVLIKMTKVDPDDQTRIADDLVDEAYRKHGKPKNCAACRQPMTVDDHAPVHMGAGIGWVHSHCTPH